MKLNTPTFRQATQQDLDALMVLEESCFSADKISRQQFRILLTKPSAGIIVAEVDKKIVGCAVVLFRKNSQQARIYSLAVDPLFRGQNIAAGLLTIVDEIAQSRACQIIVLEVRPDNTPAIRFYEKKGYSHFAIYKQFYQDGTDALRMRKYYENCVTRNR